MKKVRSVVKCIRKLVRNEEKQIGFSCIVTKQDGKLEKEINKTNTKLRKYFEGKAFIFVEKNNAKESCLNNSKLHLNRRGSKKRSSVSGMMLSDTQAKY